MDSARRETVNPREQTEPPATTIVGDPYAGNGTGTGSGNESYVDTVKQYIAPVTESVTSQAAAPGETLKNIGAQVREIATGMVKKAETETETEIQSLDPAERERVDNAEKERIEEFLKEKHKSTDGVMAPVK